MSFSSDARLAARFAARELRGGLAGFRILLACLALGVAAIAGVGSVRSAIEAGLAEEGAALLGGDAEVSFTYRFATDEERAWMEANALAVSEIADFRSMAVVERESGTERPYSSPLNNEHREGVFDCAGCKKDLFSSKTKFESGTGWPSFWQPLDAAIVTETDSTFGMKRTAVACASCGGHLGHVFDDGPKPTGLRYCMNGVAMNFKPVKA